MVSLIDEGNGHAAITNQNAQRDVAGPVAVRVPDDVGRGFIDGQLEGIDFLVGQAMLLACLGHEIAHGSKTAHVRRKFAFYFVDLLEHLPPRALTGGPSHFGFHSFNGLKNFDIVGIHGQGFFPDFKGLFVPSVVV